MPNVLTILLSAYGAVVSTVVAIFQIKKHFQDAGKLQVTASVSYLVPDPKEILYLTISATNVGRRPVTITNIGGTLKHGEDGRTAFIFPKPRVSLPHKLEESETSTLLFVELSGDIINTIKNLKALGVYDSLRRFYKITRGNLKKLKKDAY